MKKYDEYFYPLIQFLDVGKFVSQILIVLSLKIDNVLKCVSFFILSRQCPSMLVWALVLHIEINLENLCK